MKRLINIDLLEFFKTGKFDSLKLGQTKEWISQNFVRPDDVYRNNYESPIWHYGRIELHFHDDDRLFLIYSDHIDTLNAGKNIQLNKWILKEYEKLTLQFVIRHLNKEQINFKLVHGSLPSGFVSASIKLLPSQVTLGFAPEEPEYDIEEFLTQFKLEDSNNFRITSFGLSNIE